MEERVLKRELGKARSPEFFIVFARVLEDADTDSVRKRLDF
jgi:hypothetical protein